MEQFLNIRNFREYLIGENDWTEAFKKAVFNLEENNGGTLYVPTGIYKTKSIELKSNITLYLESGATLDFLDEIEEYELINLEFEGIPTKMYMPCIYAANSENVSIIGSGIINGNGFRWWKELKDLEYPRPYLVCFANCNNIKLQGVLLTNSPSWTVHPLCCNNVVIQGITIKNPKDSPNTDGIDPNSCSNVRISDCMIDVGDDCIAIKSGTEDTPRKIACENITITNCNMIHGHGGIVIGSEMSGSVRNISVSNCIFQDTDRGIRLKTRRKRGGSMENLVFQNIIMDNVLCPFIFNMYYFCGKNGKEKYVWDKEKYPIDETTPKINDIIISNIMVNNASACAGFIYGLPEQKVENIVFSNCSIKMNTNGEYGIPAMMDNIEPMKDAGFFIRNAKNIRFNNVTFENVDGENIDSDESAEVIVV